MRSLYKITIKRTFSELYACGIGGGVKKRNTLCHTLHTLGTRKEHIGNTLETHAQDICVTFYTHFQT
jgi:hypothetical protein